MKKKFLIILLLSITPIANAKSVCEKYFADNNIAYRKFIAEDPPSVLPTVSIEYSLNQTFDSGAQEYQNKKTWTERYYYFSDWKKCKSADISNPNNFGDFTNITLFCDGRKIFSISRSKYDLRDSGLSFAKFVWYDRNGENCNTSGYQQSWVSSKCIEYNDFFTILDGLYLLNAINL